MSTMRSRPLGAAPLDRRHLDTARTPFRLLLGILFVGYSSIGTILGVNGDLTPALAAREDGAVIGLAAGVIIAAGIFIAEILLAEAAIGWYLIVLAPDAWYTYRLSGWIGTIARAHLSHGLLTTVIIIAVTAVFSLAVAYFGERLLFGKRR
jgi:hypothetical protein